VNNSFDEARSAVEKARAALREGKRGEARQWAERAAALAPQMEDPWLVLAAVASPRASVEYIGKALTINPNSPRAQQGMQWAKGRLQESAGAGVGPKSQDLLEGGKKSRRSPLYPILLFGLGCLAVVFAAWSARSSPALASIMNRAPASPTPAHAHSWSHAEIAKPTYTPGSELAAAPEPIKIPIELPTGTPLPSPTDTPRPTVEPPLPPTEEPTLTPEPEYSGTLSIDYVADTPTSEIPTDAPLPTKQQYAAGGNGERWIDVDLSRQMLFAYEGDVVVNSFLVSTGTWQTPTVTGQYHVYIKLRYADMSGPGYYLPDVPYVMYFYKDYGLHGTYWHHNFGTPMSHGCVNLQTDDAGWVFNWASVGTLVNVHY
jgi:hypothetical protein